MRSYRLSLATSAGGNAYRFGVEERVTIRACCVGWLICIFVSICISSRPVDAYAQTPEIKSTGESESGGTSTDLYVMFGSDFDRPGLIPRANLNIGIGHTVGFLKRDPLGDELTVSYTYENAGTHGFIHTQFGEHTEQLGVMKNFGVFKLKTLSGYTWIQSGITGYSGHSHVLNRLASSGSLGGIIHMSYHNSIWVQESYNKVVTVPWYTTSSLGYTYSW